MWWGNDQGLLLAQTSVWLLRNCKNFHCENTTSISPNKNFFFFCMKKFLKLQFFVFNFGYEGDRVLRGLRPSES